MLCCRLLTGTILAKLRRLRLNNALFEVFHILIWLFDYFLDNLWLECIVAIAERAVSEARSWANTFDERLTVATIEFANGATAARLTLGSLTTSKTIAEINKALGTALKNVLVLWQISGIKNLLQIEDAILN